MHLWSLSDEQLNLIRPPEWYLAQVGLPPIRGALVNLERDGEFFKLRKGYGIAAKQ